MPIIILFPVFRPPTGCASFDYPPLVAALPSPAPRHLFCRRWSLHSRPRHPRHLFCRRWSLHSRPRHPRHLFCRRWSLHSRPRHPRHLIIRRRVAALSSPAPPPNDYPPLVAALPSPAPPPNLAGLTSAYYERVYFFNRQFRFPNIRYNTKICMQNSSTAENVCQNSLLVNYC